MHQNDSDDLKKLLDDVNENHPGAQDALAEAIHAELRTMARRHLARDFGPGMGGVTIQPTVLANDTLMRLIKQRGKFDSAGHLFAIASTLMMRLLLDYHRARKARKRAGGAVRVSLNPDVAVAKNHDDGPDIEALDMALEKLAALDPRKAEVVKYRVLWGLTTEEISKNLGASIATIERDWAFAKAWLAKELVCRK